MRWFRGYVSPRVAQLAPALVVLVGALSTATAQPAWASPSGAFGWGDNTRGQLGNGTTTESDIPVAMSGLSEVTTVSGGADFSLALLHDGTVVASGENGFGELGDGTGGGSSDVPVAVSGLSEVTAIAAGGNHSLALLRDGTVMAWGYNAFGQLGDGTETNSDVPVAVSSLSEVTAIAAGYNYSLALLRNGTVMAWGYNEFGTLGKGSNTQSSNPTPAPVSGLSEVTAIAAGLDGVSTALLKNGTVMDWGYGEQGELGDGTETSSDVPVAVSGLTEVTALPHGGTSMALLRDGTVVDWGLGSAGRLGNGTGGGTSDVPVAVSGLTGVTAIAGGFEQRLALLGNGTVMAWGNDSSGDLGNGTTIEGVVPVAVSGLTGVTAIAGGQYFSLAATGTSTAPPPKRPTITSLSPHSGPTTGGTTVTVTGTGFALGAEATNFRFGSVDATKVECTSTTRCTVVTPSHGARTVYVRALVKGVISAKRLRGDRFTYVGA